MTRFVRWLREYGAALGVSSLYAAVAFSMGAVVALVFYGYGFNPLPPFIFGSLVPPGLLYLLFTSSWMMTRRLHLLRRWREEGLIQAKEYDELRRQVLRWYAKRTFDTPPADDQALPQ